jgi:hypothetical protein
VNPRLVAAGLLVVAALTACSSDADPTSSPTPSSPANVWNPCDGLSAERVSGALGTDVRMETGSTDAPRCAFLPGSKGGPVVTVTYSLAPGGLDAIWQTMGDIPRSQVTSPEVPHADAAKLVVSSRRKLAAATGFVQNGGLVQVVNAADPRPYDEAAVVRVTMLVLRDLAMHADEAGVR